MKKVLFLIATLAMFVGSASSADYAIPVEIVNAGDFKGEQGEQGEQGVQGETGRTGRTGATGSQGETGAQGDTGERGTQGNQGNQGETGTNGTNGTDGIDGVTTSNDELYELLNKTASANAAIGSVELNPDHEGWSVGLGVSNRKGDAAGAIGIMYSEQVGGTEDTVQSIGYNLKFYNAEGGYRGATAGVTIGF